MLGQRNKPTEFRFESPISILELNNHSDFGRKSENYFKVKIFSDFRPQSAQKLRAEENSQYHSEKHFKPLQGKLFEQIEMIFDEKVLLVLRLYDLSNDQSQNIELSWTVLPYFIVPFTGRNMVIKFNTDIDNLNDQNLPRWVDQSLFTSVVT